MNGFKPNSGPQTWFMQSPADECFYGGLPMGGKSFAGVVDALGAHHKPRPRVYDPRYQAILFRRNEGQLSQLTRYARMFYPQMGGKPSDGFKLWSWPEGGTIKFAHMNNKDDYLIHQGHNLHYVLFDELPQFLQEQYDGILPWVRSEDDKLPAYLRCTGNPIGPGVPWVRDRFILRLKPFVIHNIAEEFEGEIYNRTIQFIPSSFRDNPYATKQFVGRLLGISNPQVKQAMISADVIQAWSIVMGSFFSQFSNVTHVVPRKDEAETLERLRNSHVTRVEGLDYGYRAPFATLWAWQDVEGDVYITNEHYVKEQRLDFHASAIHRIRESIGWEKDGFNNTNFRTIGDPSIWYEGNRAILKTDKTIGQELASRKIYCQKANNDIIQGLRCVHELLYTDGLIPPRIHIFESCTNLIHEMVNATTDKRDMERIDDSCEDHLLDSMRYLSMYLMEARRPKDIQETNEYTWDHVFQESQRRNTTDDNPYARGNAA